MDDFEKYFTKMFNGIMSEQKEKEYKRTHCQHCGKSIVNEDNIFNMAFRICPHCGKDNS